MHLVRLRFSSTFYGSFKDRLDRSPDAVNLWIGGSDSVTSIPVVRFPATSKLSRLDRKRADP